MNSSYYSRKYIVALFPKKYNKWYSAGDQVILSAVSLLFSLTLVKYSGVAQFGIYSLVFLLCQLSSAISSTLIVRQMVLFISSEILVNQKTAFSQTALIILLFFSLKLLLLAIIILCLPKQIREQYISLIIVACIYAFSLEAYDTLRQYMYVRRKQRLSFIYTLTGAFISVLLMIFFIANIDTNALHASFFTALSAGLLFTVLINSRALKDTFHLFKETNKLSDLFSTIRRYGKSGKIALIGMLATWIQNQSVTPILMFLAGPLVVGYYNLAKMVFMPVGVVVSGISKSVLPSLRRTYKESGSSNMYKKIAEIQKRGLVAVTIYFATAILIMTLLIEFEIIPMEIQHLVYVLCTGVIVSLSTFRFWLTQYFVCRLNFSLLLRSGIIGALVSVSLMLFANLTTSSTVLIILAVAVAEIVVITILKRAVIT